ncbi:MAG TPA: phage capsid protein [Micromonosporaceae bacterium]|jgi:P22 coat protein - gene protein 5.
MAAVDTFIPEVWAASLITTLEKAYVFGQPGVVNRDYEGEISQFGDTVHINTLTDPSVATYTKNSTSITPATLTTSDDTLVIDQSKYFAWLIDDIDSRQVRSASDLMSSATARSASVLRDTADQFIATTMVAGAGEILGPAFVDTADKAFLLLRNMRRVLNENNVPSDGRFVIISPDFEALVLGDNRFIDASAYGSNGPIMNGEIGRALGFRVMLSNNLPEGTPGSGTGINSHYVIAGHAIATTYAEQISKVERYRPEAHFADAVKGLHLYGAEVVRPEALVIQDTDVKVV